MSKKRKSRITPEALKELERRSKAGEDISPPFSLRTGKVLEGEELVRALAHHIYDHEK